jgi:hypothetical protein
MQKNPITLDLCMFYIGRTDAHIGRVTNKGSWMAFVIRLEMASVQTG